MTGMGLPAISVVLPVYNGARFLRETMDSILAQTFTDFEVVVVDDGSTDQTPSILGQYASRDPRIIVYRQRNRGQVAAMKLGICMARGDLIARIDADDKAFPKRFERQVEYLESNTDVVMVGGQDIVIDESGELIHVSSRPTTPKRCSDILPYADCFAHSAVTFRRDAYLTCGGYRSEYAPAEDYDLFLRLSEIGGVTNLDSTVVAYRYHRKNLSLEKTARQILRAVSASYSHDRRLAGLGDIVFKRINDARSASEFSEATFDRITKFGIGQFIYYMKQSVCALGQADALRICQEAIDFAVGIGTDDLDEVIRAYPTEAMVLKRPELARYFTEWFISNRKVPQEIRKKYEPELRDIERLKLSQLVAHVDGGESEPPFDHRAGCVDLMRVDPDGLYVQFVGWARCETERPMSLSLGGLRGVESLVVRRLKREDIARHLSSHDLLWSGFEVTALLSGAADVDPGRLSISLTTDTGRRLAVRREYRSFQSSTRDSNMSKLCMVKDGRRLAGPRDGSDVLCIMVVRNEAKRLPAILHHHMNLGVSEFFVIDNGSTDATRAILSRTPRVTVFEAKGSFQEMFGMNWVVALLDEYAQDKWCLLVDGDELFVYPHCERVSLPRLCAYLDYEECRALAALMVDMYSSIPIRNSRYLPCKPLLEAAPYFDPFEEYMFLEEAGQDIEPSWRGIGGPRGRLFWSFYRFNGDHRYFDESGYLRANPDVARAVSDGAFASGQEHFEKHGKREGRFDGSPPLLSHVPLIKWNRAFNYNVCRHQIVGKERPRLAEMRGALLHFKMLDDFYDRSLIEQGRKVHWDNASEYQRYVEVLQRAPNLSAWYPGSIRYESSATLLEQGLIRSTTCFDRYSEVSRRRRWLNPSPTRG